MATPRTKQNLFALAPELRKQLQLYERIPDDVSGDVNGLDFDPFLNAQDTADKYEFGNAQRKGPTYWVPVYGLWSGKRQSEPDVVAELSLKQGRWSFVNFHYGQKGQNGDLISTLRRFTENHH